MDTRAIALPTWRVLVDMHHGRVHQPEPEFYTREEAQAWAIKQDLHIFLISEQSKCVFAEPKGSKP